MPGTVKSELFPDAVREVQMWPAGENRIPCGSPWQWSLHNSIGDNVNIAPDVKIYDHDHNFKDHPLSGNEWRTSFITEKIEIGSNVWIGANTIILRGTIIGDNTVIGAGCILKGKFDGNCVITQKRNTSIKALKADS